MKLGTAGSICKCGLARSYHGPNPPNLADHEYDPRYDADSYALGVAAGRAEALGEVRERVEGLPFRRMTGGGMDEGGTTGDLAWDWDEWEDVVTKADVLAVLAALTTETKGDGA